MKEKIKIYANKSAVERAGICTARSVDSWLEQGKIEEVEIVGGAKNGEIMYIILDTFPKKHEKIRKKIGLSE